MPINKTYYLSEKEIANYKPLDCTNKVLIRITQRNVDRVTKGGILMISELDSDWNPSTHGDRCGEVISFPKKLKRERNHLWQTSCEIEAGDIVWFDLMISYKGDTIITESYHYKILDYFSIHVIRRGDNVIPINGYCLFDVIDDKSDSPLSIDLGKKDARLGLMKYKGSVNEYYYPEIADDDRLDIGDMCIFKTQPVLLESDYHARFEGKAQYRISQRYNVCGFVRGGKLSATVNHLIIEPVMPSETPLGIVIPECYRKPNGFGKVYDSGYHELSKDDEVYYQPNASVVIEHGGKKLHIVHFNNIYYKL